MDNEWPEDEDDNNGWDEYNTEEEKQSEVKQSQG